MENEILDLFRLLSAAGDDVSESERQNAAYTAHTLLHSWESIAPSAQGTILEALIQLRGHGSPYKGAMIETMLFGITQKECHLERAIAYLENYAPDLAAGAATFHSLGLLNFNENPAKDTAISKHLNRSVFRKLFLKNLANVKTIYNLIQDSTQPGFEGKGRVVILTRQFLMPPHAPSVDTLDFAARLIRDYGKEVLIIVTSEVSNVCDGAVAPSYWANSDTNILSAKSLSYDGLTIPIITCGNGQFSLDAVAQGLATIRTYNPEMILSVGAPSLLAEPFGDSRFCFIYPTGRGIPLTTTNYFHSWDEPDEEMQQSVQEEKLEQLYLFAQHPGFNAKPLTTNLTRGQFDIPEDAFVFVVVGLRLDNDIDDSFIDLLKKITATPKAHVAFAGTFRTYDEKIAVHPELAQKSTALGFQPDIMSVYNICDVFLNPTRKGGGSGIVYALQAQLPILSLAHGDAGMAAAGFPLLASYEEMAKTAISLMEYPETLQRYQTIAAAEAPKFTGRAQLLTRIMDEFEKYTESRDLRTTEKTG